MEETEREIQRIMQRKMSNILVQWWYTIHRIVLGNALYLLHLEPDEYWIFRLISLCQTQRKKNPEEVPEAGKQMVRIDMNVCPSRSLPIYSCIYSWENTTGLFIIYEKKKYQEEEATTKFKQHHATSPPSVSKTKISHLFVQLSVYSPVYFVYCVWLLLISKESVWHPSFLGKKRAQENFLKPWTSRREGWDERQEALLRFRHLLS